MTRKEAFDIAVEFKIKLENKRYEEIKDEDFRLLNLVRVAYDYGHYYETAKVIETFTNFRREDGVIKCIETQTWYERKTNKVTESEDSTITIKDLTDFFNRNSIIELPKTRDLRDLILKELNGTQLAI